MMASGSEVHLCVEAAERLSAGGHQVRVVSVPSLTRFAQASTRYQETILPPECVLRLSVECGRTGGWEPWVGPFGSSIGVDSFGESAPAAVLAEHFGITTEHVYARATQLLAEGSEQIDAAMAKLERAKARLVRS